MCKISLMTIGVLTIDFTLHGCRSLKEKRAVIKSLSARLKNRFNLSVAETRFLDVYDRGCLGMTVLSNNKRHANSVLDNALDYAEETGLVDITDVNMELI